MPRKPTSKICISIAVLVACALGLGLVWTAKRPASPSRTTGDGTAVQGASGQRSVAVSTRALPSHEEPDAQGPVEAVSSSQRAELDAAHRVWQKTLACYRANETLRGIKQSLDSAGSGDVTPSEAADRKLARQQRRLAQAQRDHDLCDGADEQEVADEIYPALLRLARLGDSRASACYVAAPFIPTEDGNGQELVASYKANAWDLINRGIARGDWRTIRSLESLYSRSRQTAGLFPTLAESDELMAYKYRLVRRMGTTGEYISRVDQQLAVQRKYLTDKMNLNANDFAAADEWARNFYQKNYSRSAPLEGDPAPCGNPSLAP